MNYLKPIIILTAAFSLINCDKEAEVQQKDYPYIVTNSPTVNSEGAGFSAKLTNKGNQKILKYGFVWGTEPNPTTHDNIVLFDEKEIEHNFSYSVTSGLVKDQTYYVRAYILTDQYEVFGNEKSFNSLGSLPPVINDFNPKFGPIGTKVIIEGRNFALSKTGNTVKFGDIQAIIDSASENKLIITIPKITKPEKVQVNIKTAGMSATSSDLFDLWFPWLKKKDLGFLSFNSASFTIGNTGYVIIGNSTDMITYNPVSDEWPMYITLPENSGDRPMAFSINDVAYILLNNNMWQYNPLSDNWIKKKAFPGTLQTSKSYAFGFKVDSKIYIGNCYKNYEFWEYDPNLDQWLQKSDFIGNSDQTSPVWGNYTFSLNNKGFLGVSQTAFALNTLWEYDPTEDLWTAKSPLPSNAYGDYCSFVINNEAFVGLGKNFNWSDGYKSDKIWKYDFQNDTWIEYRNCPAKLGVITSFSFDKKAYIISGYTKNHRYLNVLWEFDPYKN